MILGDKDLVLKESGLCQMNQEVRRNIELGTGDSKGLMGFQVASVLAFTVVQTNQFYLFCYIILYFF
jgi:hypothetical protein